MGPALVLSLLLAACGGGEGGSGGVVAIRQTLENGATLVRYAALPDSAVTLEADLRIGAVEGEEAYVFGDVRGIEASADGSIYILDYQASEVRRFDPEGRFVEVLAGRGQGPGEIQEANGFQLSGDSIIWVHDHGNWVMVGVGVRGQEPTSAPIHVRSYSYIWRGSVDDQGVFWKGTSHSDEERGWPPEEGLNEASYRMYLKWFDPAADATDSVFTGNAHGRSFVTQMGSGYMHSQVPFDPMPIHVVSPAGDPWVTDAQAYRVARLDSAGDTVLVIQVDEPPPPVTSEDRAAFLAQAEERGASSLRAAEAVLDYVNETKAPIAQVIFDDRGRVWVRRMTPDDEPQRFDVFQPDGTFVTSVRLGFDAVAYPALRIRHGNVYARVHDDMDVPFVVRAPLPAQLRQ